MKVVAIADQHGHLPDIPSCDLLLVAGDVVPAFMPEFEHLDWLDVDFRAWLEAVPAKRIAGIAGNHDWAFAHGKAQRLKLPWLYLEDSGAEIGGLRLWGTPWQPVFFDWAFNLPEPELAEKWALIPEDTDILLVHGPPHGYCDTTQRGERVGSPSLTERVWAIGPRLTVCGHIHEARGVLALEGAGRRKLSVEELPVIPVSASAPLVCNASLVNSRYQPIFEPFVFDFRA